MGLCSAPPEPDSGRGVRVARLRARLSGGEPRCGCCADDADAGADLDRRKRKDLGIWELFFSPFLEGIL